MEKAVSKWILRIAACIAGLFLFAVAGQVGRDIAAKFKPETQQLVRTVLGVDKRKAEAAQTEADIDEILTKITADANASKQFPKKIDDATIAVFMSYDPAEKALIYNFEVVFTKAQFDEIDSAPLIVKMRAEIIEKITKHYSSKSGKEFYDGIVKHFKRKFIYRYQSADGVHLFDITVDEQDLEFE